MMNNQQNISSIRSAFESAKAAENAALIELREKRKSRKAAAALLPGNRVVKMFRRLQAPASIPVVLGFVVVAGLSVAALSILLGADYMLLGIATVSASMAAIAALVTEALKSESNSMLERVGLLLAAAGGLAATLYMFIAPAFGIDPY